ncbi:MAG: hypothetical protein NPIRA02_40170 [Nitrospirales bacterium]|nr:MAG: hypothetical protein NPIRA02_40170 [Nitrospirales bacterium]
MINTLSNKGLIGDESSRVVGTMKLEEVTFSFFGDASRDYSTKRQSRFAIWLTDAETMDGEVIEPLFLHAASWTAT